MSWQAIAWIVALFVWIAVTVSLFRLRRWLLFYLTGAFGFVLLVVFGAMLTGFDTWLEGIEAAQVAAIAGPLGIGADTLGQTGLAIPNHVGWAVFDVGIECSALLEMAAVVGLTLFYPGFSTGRKAAYAVLGVAFTYAINIARILLIIAIINAFGTDWVFIAHAVFGRVFFFIGTVILYWFIMTRPTVARTRAILAEGAGA